MGRYIVDQKVNRRNLLVQRMAADEKKRDSLIRTLIGMITKP